MLRAHSPDRADERRLNASRGGRTGGRGRGGGGGELRELKRDIRAVIEGVLTGSLETGPAAIGLQGMNTMIRAIEVERRTHDMTDLLERLEAVEDRADKLRGRRCTGSRGA